MNHTYIDCGGAKLWTAAQGAGFPLMLCSGGPGCSDYMGPVADMIDDLVMPLRFEQRGCGHSDAAPPYDVRTCLEDLNCIRRHYGFDRWIIGGHSWGATLALLYALDYPQHTAGLICLSGGRVHNDREWHDEYHRRKEAEGEELPPMEFPPNMDVNEAINQDFKQYIQHPALLRRIAQVDVPALFLYGEHDIRPSWPVEQVAALMPNARFIKLPGTAHVLWLRQPDAVKTHLCAFIQSLAL